MGLGKHTQDGCGWFLLMHLLLMTLKVNFKIVTTAVVTLLQCFYREQFHVKEGPYTSG